MRAIKEVYNKNPGILGGDTLEFAAFHGHLMELAPPDHYDPTLKKWDASTLPIVPSKFVYLPADARPVSILEDKISSGHYDFLVNACDAGREGELIFWSFYEANGITLPVKRFWAHNNTDIDIKKALKDLRPASDYDGLRKASKLRAQFDWLTGINFTRAVSLASKENINVGRVMSPTLKLIVDRELEIERFTSTDFWTVSATFEHPSGNYSGSYVLPPKYSGGKLDTEAKAKDVAAKVGSVGTIMATETKRTSTKAPTLYSLTELQKDASKAFKFTAKETLDLTQSLYEKKVLSYPRTSSRALPTAMAATIHENLNSLLAVPELEAHVRGLSKATVDAVMKDKSYVDNAKVTDHHAIIPTTDAPVLSKLSDREQKLYIMVAKRFLAIFLPPYVTEKTVILTESGGMVFRSAGTVEVDRGFSVLYAHKPPANVLPKVKKGDAISVGKPKITKGATKPPSRYDTASLLEAMTNIGSSLSQADLRKTLRDTKGIGTESTRAEIFEKLQRVNMVTMDKKGFFAPTDFGVKIIASIGDRDICSPMMTAVWEQKLSQIEAGSYTGSFFDEMVEYVQDETASILAEVEVMSGKRPTVVGVCPICGKPVVSFPGGSYFKCQDYIPKSKRTGTDGCAFILCKEVMGFQVTDEMAETILQRKHTAPVKLTTRDGRTIEAPLALALRTTTEGTNAYAIAPYFEKKEASVDVSKLKDSDFLGECPKCGGKVYAGSKFYLCTNKDHGCDFSMAQKIKGATLSPQNMKAMLAGKETNTMNFTWASGKVGPAKLALKPDGSLKFVFDR